MDYKRLIRDGLLYLVTMLPGFFGVFLIAFVLSEHVFRWEDSGLVSRDMAQTLVVNIHLGLSGLWIWGAVRHAEALFGQSVKAVFGPSAEGREQLPADE